MSGKIPFLISIVVDICIVSAILLISGGSLPLYFDPLGMQGIGYVNYSHLMIVLRGIALSIFLMICFWYLSRNTKLTILGVLIALLPLLLLRYGVHDSSLVVLTKESSHVIQGLERYYTINGNYPINLSQLYPKYIAQRPTTGNLKRDYHYISRYSTENEGDFKNIAGKSDYTIIVNMMPKGWLIYRNTRHYMDLDTYIIRTSGLSGWVLISDNYLKH